MPADVLGVFVKAPDAGAVKTRLAADIGAEQAAALYRRMGRTLVTECVAPGRHRTFAWFAPASRVAAVLEWLEHCGLDGLRCQSGGGLGVRLTTAFDHHFREGARRVVVIGSDCPEVGVSLVERAFRALERHDLVIGPAMDGGYYLVGLKAPAPGLFQDIAWSTDAVYRQTLDHAARLGLSTAVLERLRDVDTVEDARALGLISPDAESQEESRHGTGNGHARRA
jgi:rSAM/selenodomain-associated transferase 1